MRALRWLIVLGGIGAFVLFALLGIYLTVLAAFAQALDPGAPVAPNGTQAVFISVQPADVYDSINFGKLGAVWAGMPGPYDTPVTCWCGTLAKPVTVRLRIEGRGGVHVVTADEESRVLLGTQDFTIGGTGIIATWVINGAVRFSFGPGDNLRGMFIDPSIPLNSLTKPPPWHPPAAPLNLRIEKDTK